MRTARRRLSVFKISVRSSAIIQSSRRVTWFGRTIGPLLFLWLLRDEASVSYAANCGSADKSDLRVGEAKAIKDSYLGRQPLYFFDAEVGQHKPFRVDGERLRFLWHELLPSPLWCQETLNLVSRSLVAVGFRFYILAGTAAEPCLLAPLKRSRDA